MTNYLVAAYAVFWAGTLIYVLSLGARQRGLAKKVESLAEVLAEREGARE